MKTSEDLLQAWLPGGITGIRVICLSDKDFTGMQTRIKTEFPSMKQQQAVDCRSNLRTLQDFKDLPFSVAFGTQLNILTKRSQKTMRDIVTPGPIGASQSHLSIWAEFAKYKNGWTVVFESDVYATVNINKFIQYIVSYPLSTDALPGIIKLGWAFAKKGHTRRVAPGLCKVIGGASPGLQAYIIRNELLSDYIRMLTPIGDHIDGILTDLSAADVSASMWITDENICAQPWFQLNSMHGTNFNFRIILPENTIACNAVILVPFLIGFILIGVVVWLSYSYYQLRAKCQIT